MPTDRATIFFVTERPDDDKLPLRGIYLTDIWHGQGLHRRAIKELQTPLVKECWLKGPLLVRLMLQRLLHACASQNEAPDCEVDTTCGPTEYLVLVVDFTSGDVRLRHPCDCEAQKCHGHERQPFAKADKLDCGKPDKDE